MLWAFNASSFTGCYGLLVVGSVLATRGMPYSVA